MNIKFDLLNKSMDWVVKYGLAEKNYKEIPSKEIVDFLNNNCVFNNEMIVYRGINFKTKTEYDFFLNRINKHVIDFSELTSWSICKNIAHDFATGERSILDVDMSKQYKGLIISATVDKRNILFDISKVLKMLNTAFCDKCLSVSPMPCMRKEFNNIYCEEGILVDLENEKEIVLLPQKYKINILEEIDL